MNCSLPDSSVHGILQERILMWVAMPCFWGSSDPGIEPKSPLHLQTGSLLLAPPGKPVYVYIVDLKTITFDMFHYLD